MKQTLVTAITLTCVCLMGFNYGNIKQKDFIGVWQLVSIESIAKDSSVSYPYGEKPMGRMMIDKDGNYMVEIYTNSRTKIASGSKSSATPEENMMMVKGSNAHYGKFIADVEAKTLLYKPEGAFFPNWQGQELKSTFTLQDGLLKSYSINTTFGAAKAIVTWQKIK
ncbi:MAG: lipocalin-like domain-containing protein [Spirosomataceae bacterium]